MRNFAFRLKGAATAAISTALLAGALAGCGGSSGSGGSGGVSRSAATVNLYVTDGFRDDWSQVLVTLYRIEVSSDSGATYTTLYENTSGQSLDLASLKDAAQLLSSASVSASASITNVRVTLGDTISLTPTGGGTVQTKTIDSTLPNVTVANNQATFTFAASTSLHAGQLSNLVVDFKLAAFELISGKIRPALAPGDGSTFDGKQKVAHLSGTVSHYVAGSGFDLTPNCGQGRSHGTNSTAGTPATIPVALTTATTITSGSAATALANGASVTVEGNTDAATGIVTATVVHVRDAADDSGAGMSSDSTSPRGVHVLGAVAALASDGVSFTLMVRDGEHIPAANSALTIQTDASTVFLQGRTLATLSAVTAGSYVFVEGTLDPATSILTAHTVAVLPAASTGHDWPDSH